MLSYYYIPASGSLSYSFSVVNSDDREILPGNGFTNGTTEGNSMSGIRR